jgi:hypothetical protein
MTLSRRGFLQAAGISLAASRWGAFSPLATLAAGAPFKGRVLEPISMGGQALWPDSVVTILDADSARYRLERGWVLQSTLQPMSVDQSAFDGTWPSTAFDAEVSAPLAVVYVCADAASNPIARIGHGGVLTVVQHLPDEAGNICWLGVQTTGSMLGWTQAAHWQPALSRPSSANVDTIRIDHARQRLTALSGDDVLLATAISTSPDRHFEPLQSIIDRWLPHLDHSQPAEYSGIPWALTSASGHTMAGAYWHNRFGTPQPGPDIQLPPAVAKWLYLSVTPDVTLEIM